MNEIKIGDVVERITPGKNIHKVGCVDTVEKLSISPDGRAKLDFGDRGMGFAVNYKLHIPAWQPQPGEEVEVSDCRDFKCPQHVQFLSTYNDLYIGQKHCDGKIFMWAYCRPLQPEIKITIDGEPFNPSEKLRKEILDELERTNN